MESNVCKARLNGYGARVIAPTFKLPLLLGNWMKIGPNKAPSRSLTVVVMLCATAGCGDKRDSVPKASTLYLQAMEHIGAGEADKALEALNQSIEVEPQMWAYRERAKIHEKRGEDKAAMEDVEAAIKLAPDDAETLWLKGELAKPKGERFQGKFATPPVVNR